MQSSLTTFQARAKQLQLFVFGVPVLSSLISNRTGIPFPPMGQTGSYWRFFALAMIGTALAASAVLPRPKKQYILPTAFLSTFIAISALYLTLNQYYVVPINYPQPGKSEDATLFVTRGSQRVNGLQEPYLSMSDEDLIKATGQSDDRLEHVYTKRSLCFNRAKLYCSYVLSLIFLELGIGSVAATESNPYAP